MQRWVWFFDLDDTLHQASGICFPVINAQMTAYVARKLGVDEEEAGRVRQRYWQRYGATLMGMIHHHGVRADEFLQQTHVFEDMAALLRAEKGLRALLQRLPGRKVLVTNAPMSYAAQVLNHLKLSRHFHARVSIERMCIHGRYRPKPSRLLMPYLAARQGCRPSQVVLVDDALPNLRAARMAGMRTVLMTGHGAQRRAGRPLYAGQRIRSLWQLLRMGALRS